MPATRNSKGKRGASQPTRRKNAAPGAAKASPSGARGTVTKPRARAGARSAGKAPARRARTLSPIDALELVDYAKAAAEALLAAHPGVVFTSGRRNAQQQAHAMAGNVAKNRQWIVQTYTATAESTSLQDWVDRHPLATSRAAIAAGLVGIMNDWTDGQKARLSRHFSGQAFDVQPVANGEAIKKTIRSLPNLRKFLDKEGGLIIWHADFEQH